MNVLVRRQVQRLDYSTHTSVRKKNPQSYSTHYLILNILYHSKIVQDKLRLQFKGSIHYKCLN